MRNKKVIIKYQLIEGIMMAYNYNKLWKLMIDSNMNRTQLRQAAHISTNALARLGKNEKVTMDTLEKICKALNCDIGDIVEISHEKYIVK